MNINTVSNDRPTADVSSSYSSSSLLCLYEEGEHQEFLREALGRKLKILVAGPTASGKTVLTETLLRETPPQEKTVVIERTAEMSLSKKGVISFVRNNWCEKNINLTTDDVMKHKPNRVVLAHTDGGFNQGLFGILEKTRGPDIAVIAVVHALDIDKALPNFFVSFLNKQAEDLSDKIK